MQRNNRSDRYIPVGKGSKRFASLCPIHLKFALGSRSNASIAGAIHPKDGTVMERDNNSFDPIGRKALDDFQKNARIPFTALPEGRTINVDCYRTRIASKKRVSSPATGSSRANANRNPNPPPGRLIQTPPEKQCCKYAVFRYAPEPYFQPICWPIFTLKYFDSPNLTSEAACLIGNIPLQIMKGFGTLYATARSKDRTELAVEFKVASALT